MEGGKGKGKCDDIVSKSLIIILKSNLRETVLILAPGTVESKTCQQAGKVWCAVRDLVGHIESRIRKQEWGMSYTFKAHLINTPNGHSLTWASCGQLISYT